MKIERLKRIIGVIVNFPVNGEVKVQDENTGVQYDVSYVTMSDPQGLGDLIIHIRPNQPIPGTTQPTQPQSKQPPYDLPLQKGATAHD